MDFAATGLLDGLDGEARAAREQLLARLADEGFTLEELKGAVAEDRLALLPVQRVLGGRYTAAEVDEQTGARVLGEAMSRVASSSTAVFADAFLEQGDSEEDVAWRFAELAEQLTPRVQPVLLAAYKAHLRENVQRVALTRAELEAGQVVGEQETAVCFADLVGFTTLGAEIEAQELGGVIGRFGELAAGVADSQVRLVKTIGDAAMFAAREPGPLVGAALSLIEAVEEADLSAIRAGVAFGMAVPVAGDMYGHAVNLASRVTAIARPGSVLCTGEVRDAAPEQFDWSFAGKHRLKGIGDSVPLYRARRPAPSSDGSRASRPKAGRRRRRAAS